MRFIESISVFLGTSSAGAGSVDDATQKKQLERLLAAVRPLADTLLERYAEFYPYGATMSPDGKITDVAGDTGVERPKSVELITLLKEGYRQLGASRKILACALVYDVRVVPPGQSEKVDAVAIDLEHRDGMTVTMVYPYHIDSEMKVIFGKFFATKGHDDIFPRKKGAD